MHHDPNIAPQHIFDNVGTLNDSAFAHAGLPPLMNHASPSSLTSMNNQQLDAPLTYDQLLAQNTILKTRVSELEVINMVYSDNENNLRRERDEAVKVQEELKRKVDDLEKQLQLVSELELERPVKRTRIDSPMRMNEHEQRDL